MIINDSILIKTVFSLNGISYQLKNLMDICFPEKPRNVFLLIVENYRSGDQIHYIENNENKMIGIVFAVKNSKGFTLENLAIHPNYRNNKFSIILMDKFLDIHKGIITLTTRIPGYFEKFRFRVIDKLPDGSFFMYFINIV